MPRRIPRGDRQTGQICFRSEAASFHNSFEHGGGRPLEHDFPRFLYRAGDDHR